MTLDGAGGKITAGAAKKARKKNIIKLTYIIKYVKINSTRPYYSLSLLTARHCSADGYSKGEMPCWKRF
ncbi:MAG: hypothetical protein A2008_01590 [Candidatus Wallbacteria bacterium GWC2_49_35]|uniref:Uncharacterized protein n=1 Tax=Candidatus Wallbacteria bacterium GWC2_49_35 TaxID=1817813 RepID=A0A1F7WGK7_9BACT|nr:MAG: hypothetical protein A2008_01590 [Candidatus Wallbacteria bacterium GWC2_49_35]HBC73912.1 hypothetical protein [Candidatus Wallbacteria bacterium]